MFPHCIPVAGYLAIDMELQWKVNLPVALSRAAILVADALYPIEVFLWPAAVITIAREWHTNDLTNRWSQPQAGVLPRFIYENTPIASHDRCRQRW
jgi:hypothetical protein